MKPTRSQQTQQGAVNIMAVSFSLYNEMYHPEVATLNEQRAPCCCQRQLLHWCYMVMQNRHGKNTTRGKQLMSNAFIRHLFQILVFYVGIWLSEKVQIILRCPKEGQSSIFEWPMKQLIKYLLMPPPFIKSVTTLPIKFRHQPLQVSEFQTHLHHFIQYKYSKFICLDKI